MSKIFWDTMIFVYWLEENPQYAKRVNHVLTRMQARGDDLCTSALTVGEVLVGPVKVGAADVVAKLKTYFQSPAVTLIPFSLGAAIRYANLRAQYTIPPADAAQLSCAAESGADLFLTNDKRLVGMTIPGIQFVVGLDTNLF